MTKQPIKINFAQGIDSKTDPKQLSIGQFTSLTNSVFDVGGQLTKRNGYKTLAALPSADYTYVTTFNDDLTAIGNNIAAYSIATASWVQKGSIQPLSLSVLPVLRNNFNQTSCDIAVAPNGLACCVYAENDSGTLHNKYVVYDSVTGQNIVAPTDIPVVSGIVTDEGGSRVFVLGSKFIIVTTYGNGPPFRLQYFAISTANPTVTVGPTTMSNAYTPNTRTAWDAVVVGNNLFFAYMSTVPNITVNTLNSSLVLGSGTTLVATAGQSLSLCSDTTVSPNIIYINWFDGSTSVKIGAVNASLAVTQSSSAVESLSNVVNIASAAQNGICTIFYEVSGNYSYDTKIPNNDIRGATFSGGGTTSTFASLNGVGLGSKAFIYNSLVYYLAAYQSPYQPTYFLINGSATTTASPVIVAKLAYGNGGGYLTSVLPSVSLSGNVAVIPYLFKDLVQSVNKNTNVPAHSQVAGIYTQTGINMSTIAFGTKGMDTEEIGNNLHLAGGFLGMYDGYLPVEHNFFLWPDSVNLGFINDVVVTGNTSNVSPVITSVSSTAGLKTGMSISGTGITAGSFVVSFTVSTVTMNQNGASTQTTTSLTFGGAQPTDTYFYQVTYEWSDNQGNIFRSAPSIPVSITTSPGSSSVQINFPELRLTMKTANPVKIVIYRWSVTQPEYYQVTSITSPLINITTAEFDSFFDFQSNDQILGNNLLYTTGGVVEDVNAPASNLFTLFDTRFWLVDAEDQNKIWYSKQVIPSTPVEMSDLLTLYVPPSVGTELNTGPITAITTMDDKLLMAKSTSWVYINGTGPDNTGLNSQYSQPIYVTSTVGCSNQHSIVLSPNGLMFQSSKGIWLIGRDLQTSFIGAPVQAFTASSRVTSADLMPATTQVRFTMDSGITLMYDYYYGQWAVFNINAVDSCIFQGLQTYIDGSANIMQETPGLYLDGTTPVTMAFQTGPIRLGDMDNYQRVYFFYLLGTYYSPHFLTLSLTYDYGASPSQTITIEPGSQVGISSGSLESWRIFPQTQRCRAISIGLQESYDATLGPAAGQGLSLSGINAVCGFKKGFVPTSSANSAG